MKKTNYVVAVDFDENDDAENTLILGWNNNYDWFDVDSYFDDIIDKNGNIPDTEYGLIDVDRWTQVYVGETVDDVKEYAEGARSEDINAIVVRIDKDDNGYKLTPAE